MHSFVSVYYNIGADISNTIALYEMNNNIITNITNFADKTLTNSNGVAIMYAGENDIGD